MGETVKRTVHFTLGDGAGKLLTDIAREKIIYSLTPNEGLATIQESLIGCPKNIALDIIKGKLVLETAEDNVSFNVIQYHPDMKEQHPPFDIEGWAERTLLQIKEIAREWDQAILEMRRAIIKNQGTFDISVSYQKLVRYFYTGEEDNIIDPDENETVYNIKSAVTGIRNFLEECYKKMDVIKWLANAYPEDIPEGFLIMPGEVKGLNLRLTDMMLKDSEVEQHIARNLYMDNLVTRFIENEKNIDKVISEGIQPVEITDKYSAGWLAPNGDFYGLNGEIANMLHNQLADALYKKGIVPRKDADGDSYERNPDGWLCKHGWVRIHGDHLLYDGYMQSNYGMPLVKITEAQKKQIVRYGAECYDGYLRFGCTYTRYPVSTFYALPEPHIGKLFDLDL